MEYKQDGYHMEDVIAVLDLPDGKNDVVKFEDRVFSFSYFVVDELIWPKGNVLEYDKGYIIFKVPEGVDDVCLKLYKHSIQNCFLGNSYMGELKFKLNRK